MKEIVVFEAEDKSVVLNVAVDGENVWLIRNQMSELFGRDIKTIGKHIANAMKEELNGMMVVAKFATTTPHGAVKGKFQTHMSEHYNLDVIISVGYRVKSKRGVEFRKWANSVLKQYIIKGYAANQRRMKQLGKVIQILKRSENDLDSQQVLSVIEKYSAALELLDGYDHQNLIKPSGNKTIAVLEYSECVQIIQKMRLENTSDLFGLEKDDSFKGSVGNIYQTFDGDDVYPSLEEKAANLLYFITKKHSFVDGNKRIVAAMFLCFLDKNQALFVEGKKKIDDSALAALTIMTAESKPDEKEMMIRVIMNCMI